jgi:hypothetical protein
LYALYSYNDTKVFGIVVGKYFLNILNFLKKINIFFIFSDNFNVLMSKIIF